VGEKIYICVFCGSDRRSAVCVAHQSGQQFMWHTSQATLTQCVRLAYGKTQALKGVMKTMTIVGEHNGGQTI
jgi:hypothetical protein